MGNPPANGPSNGHYYLLAYTGEYQKPQFLFHDQDKNVVVSAISYNNNRATDWAVLYEGVNPDGYRIWRHPIDGHLLDHDVANSRAIVYPINPQGRQANQTWAVEKHKYPTEDDPDNYYYAIKSLSSENAGYLTRGGHRTDMEDARNVVVKPTSWDGQPEWSQRWVLVPV